ncbi:MAG: LAGLIDADG family homing endonuclease [bacterium]|nr:LAGLIDADG family homing endonuclease [bacterium]
MVQRQTTAKNALHELGYKIFLDRYAQKDMTRSTLAVGDTVIVVVNSTTGQREIGKVTAMQLPEVTIQLLDGETVTRDLEHVDKPLETDPSQMMDRVARGIAEIEADEATRAQWAENFRWLLDDFKFVPAGRILAAAGTDQQLTYYNCYVIPSPRDSRGGIIETLRQMTEIMSRGGGVGINISSLRPRHSYVKGVNGRSSGAVSWGALYSFVTGLIEQGGSRRGALMLILNDWHPDIYDFINSKRTAGKITNANISVGLSDKFMEAVKADGDWELLFPDSHHPTYDEEWDGDLEAWMAKGYPVQHYKTVQARDVWNAIIESAWSSAEPGVWFRERANKESNSWYFNPLIATNPCVTGDTLIYTDQGLRRACDLVAQQHNLNVVIDGRFGDSQTMVSSSPVFKTGTKPVYRVQTYEGYYVRATADHRVMTTRGWVEVQHLQPNDRIHILNRKGGFGDEGSVELGRVLGWVVGDGTIKRDEVVLSFFGAEKQELAPLFADYVNTMAAPLTQTQRQYPVTATQIVERDEARVTSTRLHTIIEQHGLTAVKHRVPETVFAGSEAMQRGFLQALFTADGSFQDGGEKGGSVRLAANALALLEGVQQLLLNFGIFSRIYRNRRTAGYRMMPDSNRQLASYWCEAQHELVISRRNMGVFAAEIGFLMPYKQQALEGYMSRGKRGLYSEKFTAQVESVTEDGIEDVFDLTEPLTHSFIANGIVVHNCGEQSLAAWSVCNLGAINLAKFYDEDRHDVKWDDLDRAVRYATRFLDNVIDSTPYFFDENAQQQLGERRVGLNNMGLAELMIRLGIRYGSDESVAFIDKLYSLIARASYETSAELAQEKGVFPNFDAEKFLQSGFMQSMPNDVRETIREKGIRNVTLLTQAPTGTTGTMVNTSTGIEPFFSWVYYRKSRLGLHEEQVPLVKEWHEANPGADQLPDYFVTAMDLTPTEHVRVQAAIQRWVDSSISKTANLPNSYTLEQTRELYEYMYDMGCKGGTVYRDGSRDEQVLMLKDNKADASKAETPTAEIPAQPAPTTPAVTQVATPHYVYPRPARLQGVTVSVQTPYGTAYVTMNSDEHGYPFEVFITAPGKAGSDLQADAEGLGRMISLQLRTTAPQNRNQMLKLVIDQLQGIGGSRSIGMGPKRVTSLPDAVAGALLDQYFPQDRIQQMSLFAAQFDIPVETFTAPAPASLPAPAHTNGHDHEHAGGTAPTIGYVKGAEMCPSCGTMSLLRIEGCKKCSTCGYSEC